MYQMLIPKSLPEFINFYYCIEHLYYYNPKTIKLLFDATGFQGVIETIQEYPLANHLNWIYCRKPSDTLASRKVVPGVFIKDTVPIDRWNKLWEMFNQHYQVFLKENGFADRIWATLEIGKTTVK